MAANAADPSPSARSSLALLEISTATTWARPSSKCSQRPSHVYCTSTLAFFVYSSLRRQNSGWICGHRFCNLSIGPIRYSPWKALFAPRISTTNGVAAETSHAFPTSELPTANNNRKRPAALTYTEVAAKPIPGWRANTSQRISAQSPSRSAISRTGSWTLTLLNWDLKFKLRFTFSY